MDHMVINSEFLTKLLSKIVAQAVTNATGCEAKVSLRNVTASHPTESGYLELGIDAAVNVAIPPEKLTELVTAYLLK